MSDALPMDLTIDGVRVREREPLAPFTTYKIGGPARWLIEVEARAALPELLSRLAAADVPWLVLGNGSNVLVSDRGFAGAVLVLGGELAALELTRDAYGPGAHRVRAGAAVSMTRLLRLAKDEALSDLWVLAGIPGTVGGAVRMNAGTRFGELARVLVGAEVCSSEGYRFVENDRLNLSYRASELPAGTLVTSADLRVGDADPAMRDKLDEVLAYRKATQPLHLPSCGSVFANPPGDAAGRLIEAAGLKGRREGGAEISPQHANWIVNLGAATAADVHALITTCRREVLARTGVLLRPEVQLVGDWTADERRALHEEAP
ncbi:MAG: UDP-N-acetylmuramate dehydrogenase [Deltaproteobacteria bacterium]|nr:UDP-N-acetylmuramate dehydrogenase [Deltaproteobacteria bacterium]